MFVAKPQIGELIVKFLPSVSEEFPSVDCKIPILLNVVTTIPIDALKSKLEKVTSIPKDRLLLLFCGLRLASTVPLNAFESLALDTTIDDIKCEDDIIFRPRIYLALLPKDENSVDYDVNSVSTEHLNSIHARDDQDDYQSQISNREKLVTETEDGHHTKKKHFNLKTELASIDCVQHFDTMNKAGYNNKGAIANLTEADLMAPGMWMPRRASLKILKLAETYKESIQEDDVEKEKNAHTKLEQELLETGQAKTVSIEGLDGTNLIFNSKAAIKRAWEHAQHQKAINERNARLHKVEEVVVVEDPTKKVHSDSLQARIDAIRKRCAQVDDEEGTEDYYGIHSLSKPTTTPHKSDPIAMRIEKHIYCCDKHKQAVDSKKETFIKQRKQQHLIEFEVLLNQLESHRNGFVRSSTLLSIAKDRLNKYKYVVSEEELNALVYQRCAMDLNDQQLSLKWIARDEMKRDHLATLIPVKRFSGSKFVVEFTNLLEILDRRHFHGE